MGIINTFFTDGNYGEAYPKASDMTDSSSGIPFLTGGNLKEGKLSLDGVSYITPEKHSQLISGHLLEDDIVIAVRGSLGALGYVNTDNSGWNINSQLAILRTDKSELYGKFLIQYLLSWAGQNELLKRQTGSALKQLPIGALKDVEVPITSVAEQERIATYFDSLDHLITLHQRKCEETKILKKYMLQKMFPQNGQKVPEIRFKGFTDDWEQRKLGDVLERRIEQRQQSEEYPRLAFASGQGVIPLSERKTNNREQLTKDEYTKKYLVTELNDIVYNPANVKYGAIDRNKCGRGLISPIYVTFTTNEIPGFIERIVTSHDFQQRALRFEEGTVTKRQSVNPEDLVTLDILVAPKREEQQKIATYFDSLDHLITLHQRKCEELQNIKKFMLQNMFV